MVAKDQRPLVDYYRTTAARSLPNPDEGDLALDSSTHLSASLLWLLSTVESGSRRMFLY
jgi:hypothetical protein